MKYTVILEDMCATVLCARTGGKWMWNRSEVRPHCSCIQRPSWWALTWQGEPLRSAQTVTWSDSQTCQFAWKTEAARPVKVKAIIALLSSLFTAKSLGWLQKVWASAVACGCYVAVVWGGGDAVFWSCSITNRDRPGCHAFGAHARDLHFQMNISRAARTCHCMSLLVRLSWLCKDCQRDSGYCF